MDSQERQKIYEEYITEASPAAAAIGRRAPYHLEYLRKHGDVAPATAEGRAGTEGGDVAYGSSDMR